MWGDFITPLFFVLRLVLVYIWIFLIAFIVEKAHILILLLPDTNVLEVWALHHKKVLLLDGASGLQIHIKVCRRLYFLLLRHSQSCCLWIVIETPLRYYELLQDYSYISVYTDRLRLYLLRTEGLAEVHTRIHRIRILSRHLPKRIFDDDGSVASHTEL